MKENTYPTNHNIKLAVACVLLSICFLQYSFSQQIIVDNTQTPQQLIENNLIQGCVEVSNIVSNVNGNANGITSYGYFEQDNSSFPFQNGIVLSTGNATSAGNTNNTNTLNDGDASWPTDPDLESALGISNTVNATSIEFDFVSVSNQIQFNYILASEEYYATYPCEYSDGFAFLLKEVGASSYTNIAVIPGTSTPVNTNTIHDEIVGFCPAENESYFDGYNLGDTNFNGRTTVLSASASIQPNVQYHIKLVIADQADQNFDSAVFIEGNSFNATVDLGEDITTCADSVSLNANTQNPLATYEWFLNGTLIPGEILPNLDNITQSGTYQVVVTMPISTSFCEIQDEIVVNLSSEQTADAIADYQICDDISNDETETFDLSTMQDQVLDAVPSSNYTISYYYSSEDAHTETNPITAPITNTTNPQVIHVKIEDTNNGCLSFATFNLVVNPLPTIVEPTQLDVCDDTTSDGFTTIDLSVKDEEITGGNANYIVNYHYSQIDAENVENAIPLPYANTNATEQLFVSVVDATTGCISTTTLTINVLENPDINQEPQLINACEIDDDGFASFDLSTIIPDVLQGLTGVTVTFHTTYEDAQTGDNPITDYQNFDNTVPNLQIVYIRVVNDATGCAAISSVELYANLIRNNAITRDFTRCDDDSNDGIYDFDLENIANTVASNIEDATVTFYETEEDQNNTINEIDQSVLYTVTDSPHTLYVTIETDDCIHLTSIRLVINPPTIIQPLSPVDYCDTNDDGFTSISLEDFNDYVSEGITNASVSYFLTEEDANNNENALPPFYTNTTNPQIVFTRVLNTDTGCHDVAELEIQVIPAPTVMQPEDIIICDDDYDGAYLINLEDKIDEIVASTTDLIITFHTSANDANSNNNAITNTIAYNANTQTIYTRVESEITSCFALVVFQVIVNTEPIFTDITNFRHCEIDGDQTGDFIFNQKDAEILNGQPGKRALYFETAQDAIDRTNIINKNVAYQNTANPQTIHVRVENISDTDCFDTSSFTIEVGLIPEYIAPVNWMVCDDIANDGIETFDLSEKIDEMSAASTEDLTITFYTSFEDADNGENNLDLEFQNTENPQQIYARIENGTYCHGISEFSLNIIQVPNVNPAAPLQKCDTDTDGFTNFDLTVVEVDVFGVRQDNIEVSYHPSFQDVEDHTNIITNPTNYTNISNPQTAYIKITSTISNCYVAVPIELIVDVPTSINNVPPFETCDNAEHTYNLEETIDSLVDDTTNLALTFYSNLEDAENNQNAVNANNYNYSTNDDTIFVRAENTISHCYATSSFVLHVNSTPIIYPITDLETCDDDYDAFALFNLDQQTAIALGDQNPNNFTVSYFELEEEAMLNENKIEDLNYDAFDGQTFYIRIENKTTLCYDIASFNTIVHRKPIVEIEDQTICLESLPLIVSANTGYSDDTYSWSTNATTSEIEITEIGDYSVTVTTAYGCTSSATFNVIESEQATIEFTEQVDFSDPNNITVTISGIGDYFYILDNGPAQESNFFNNVTLGPHTITVLDANGCASAVKEIVIIDTPLFMTPNNDGYNDTWHITGVNQLTGTIVHIFDRYGKLIKTLSHTSPGWDGTYRGQNLPADDYWFLAEVIQEGKKFELKGNFTLKR
ncbi:choice-of-anchor L domain-containing protein [Lacinutrix gracilariae]|uniref:Choice-of-anchor L domain-containing protein n=1 Tax=Lacinutrix gracilariae TaxID=1747198 RepID=A0ABW5JZZ2_9FLAO